MKKPANLGINWHAIASAAWRIAIFAGAWWATYYWLETSEKPWSIAAAAAVAFAIGLFGHEKRLEKLQDQWREDHCELEAMKQRYGDLD